MSKQLLVFETHPIQYHAPVYRYLQQELEVPVTVVYGSDFSVAGYHDKDFDVTFSWDSDLLSGYSYRFLSTLAEGGVDSSQGLTGNGIAEVLAEVKPTAVLLNGYGFPFHRAAFWQAMRGRYPLLFRSETTDTNKNRSGAKKFLRDTFLRWYYAQFNALLPIGVNSNAHYNRLAPVKTPRFLSPYCVNITPFAPDENARKQMRIATRQQLGLQDNQCAILFSGKLIDIKAPELLLESIKQLPIDEREKTVVLFLGDGPLHSFLETTANSEPKLHTRFLGFQNQTSLSPYYHAADLLVLPSLGETWGLVVNEALHHGLPCIVSDRVGCAPDLIISRQTGEIFIHNDAAQLTAAIRRAGEWIGTNTVRHQCRAHIANYTIEKAAIGIADAYHYICQS